MPSRRQPDPAEADLITRAIAGDREAFGALYEHFLPAIYRYVFYRLADEHDAEDLTEMVFVRAWEALGRYRPTEAPFSAWLYRIAHNLLIDRHRTQRMLDTLDEQVPDVAPDGDPESQAARRERARSLAQALARLDPVQQQVLTLRFINNLSRVGGMPGRDPPR
jgi:RNA polymerase sigma-70 factor (ECF subfamily)